MKTIELEFGCERPLFEIILANPEKIVALPKGYYEKFLGYMIQEEMYEDIPKLEAVKNKISDETLDEMLKNCKWIEIK